MNYIHQSGKDDRLENKTKTYPVLLDLPAPEKI